MGQYYKACILEELKKGKKTKEQIKSWLYSWDYECGLKLMEHSWMKNPYVKTVESLLEDNPQRIVWSGDYADNEHNQHYVNNEGEKVEYNLYELASEDKKVLPKESSKYYRYVINHDKKMFVDKRNVVKDSEGWRIHPLPLLTVEGNNRGGGDFRGESPLIGAWSRDKVSVSTKKPKEYKELIFDLVE